MTGYDPGAECALCKGKCCREKGCSLSPEDMLQSMGKKDGKADRQEILELLKKENGQYAVDFFTDQEGPCFYIRMKHKCYTFVGVDAIGICIALEEKGCVLPMEQRPKGGRFLESRAGGQCIQHYTKQQMREDWRPYQESLSSIYREYEKLFREDGTFDRCDEAYFAYLRRTHEAGRTV